MHNAIFTSRPNSEDMSDLQQSQNKSKMKTDLPNRSLVVKSRLGLIVHEILAAGKDKIAMIILFGSYARGDWVKDIYTEGHITYSY